MPVKVTKAGIKLPDNMCYRFPNEKAGFCRNIALFLFFLLSLYSANSQQALVFVDRNATPGEKASIMEMVDIINQSSRTKLVIDSVSRFSGRGIYITTVKRDYYDKAPSRLKKMGEEAVYLEGSDRHQYIVANTALGLQHGVFLYLERLGFRFYFPDPAWHTRPMISTPFISFEQLTEPDFHYRRIFMGFGYGTDKLRQQFLFWERANRMGGALQVQNGHAYQRLLADKKEEFEKHPEYLSKPLLNGKKQPKTVFNFSSPGLAQLAYEWLAENFDRLEKKGTPVPMLSMEPFDGRNYCDLPECKKIGTTASDQVFYFTNEVAKKLKKTHPDKKIGMLAYYEHIDIPRYQMEDNIFVTITNGYNTSAYSTDELIDRWKTKVKGIGMYDYMSVYAGSNDLPGRGLAGNYKNVAAGIRKYKKQGVTAYQAESTYGWMGKGLSHYIAARLTWNTDADVSQIINEFFDLNFPQTKEFIRPMLEKWNSSFVLTENELHEWFSALGSAFKNCNEPNELKRLNQLALYVNYVKMFREFQGKKAKKQSRDANELLRYMWDIMDEGVVASLAGVNTLVSGMGKDYAVMNKNASWRTAKINYPGNKQEWISFIDGYLPGLKRIDLAPRFKKKPFRKLEIKKTAPAGFWKNPHKAMTFRGDLTFIADIKHSDSLFIKLKGGRIKKTGNVGLKVYEWNDEMIPEGRPVKEFSFDADGRDNIADFRTLDRGKYIFVATDESSSGATIYFPSELKYSVLASETNPLKGAFYNYYYFYVPEDVEKFYIVKSHYVKLIDPQGKQTGYATSIDNLVEIKVGKGQHGWWKAHLQLEQLYFIGIPPLVSRDPQSYFFPD